MVKTIFKIIGIILLVGYLLAAGFMYGFWRSEPRYRNLKVVIEYPSDEAHFITEASIRQLVESKPGFKYKGKTYAEVNTLELSQYIEEHNRLIRRATCCHTPDSLLRIDVEQRNPIMRVKSLRGVKDDKGNSLSDFYIDYDGEIMPDQAGVAIRLPLTTGYVRKEQVAQLHDFALYLKKHDFWADDITQICVLENGDVELIPRIGNHRILLGPLEGYEQKLKNVRTFYDKVLPRKGWNAYKVINVKFNGQVIGEK